MSAPTGSPRRTQAERRAASETALLQAAAELIVEGGMERASLRNISERAGISRGMPAYHFGSKDGLVERLVEQAYGSTFEATGVAVEQGARDLSRLTKLEALRAIIETYLRIFHTGERPEERAVVVLWG